MAKAKREILDSTELAELQERPYYEAGKPYLWTLGFGWAIVGFFVKHTTPTRMMVAHANHFRNAGKDYGRLALEGAGPECEWRYEGLDEINMLHVLKAQEYFGEVPRG